MPSNPSATPFLSEAPSTKVPSLVMSLRPVNCCMATPPLNPRLSLISSGPLISRISAVAALLSTFGSTIEPPTMNFGSSKFVSTPRSRHGSLIGSGR